jgi:hypothetical protein
MYFLLAIVLPHLGADCNREIENKAAVSARRAFWKISVA